MWVIFRMRMRERNNRKAKESEAEKIKDEKKSDKIKTYKYIIPETRYICALSHAKDNSLSWLF